VKNFLNTVRSKPSPIGRIAQSGHLGNGPKCWACCHFPEFVPTTIYQFQKPGQPSKNGFSKNFENADRQGCQMVKFKPKIPILVNFRGPCNGTSWYILGPFV
jgi:hypothetical protein